MPTNVVGLAIFVALLAPGLSFNVYRAANSPAETLTTLRELAGVVLRSLIWDSAALLVFAILRSLLPSHTPDFGAFARNGGVYARAHLAYLLWWSAALLGLACALAVGAAVFEQSSMGKAIFGSRRLAWLRPSGSVSTQSAWWFLFNQSPGNDVFVGVTLDDGTYFGGQVLSYSPNSDETVDRELTLGEPIQYRAAAADDEVDLEVSAVTLSARRIQFLTVTYLTRSGSP